MASKRFTPKAAERKMKPTTIGHVAKILLFLFWALILPAQAQPAGAAYKVIKVDGRAAGAVSSDGILAGNTLYIAAQDGRSSDGTLPADFAQEARRSLAHMREVLKAAGMDMGNLAWVQVYLTRSTDIA